jgi:prepilin-type N-terminal cleavage/methylation domain-containing protein
MTSRADASARAPRGFTLAELIVTIIILGLVAGATTAVLAQAVRARDRSIARTDAFTRAQLAVDRIAAECQSALRDSELQYAKVLVTPGPPGPARADALLLFTHPRSPVRPGSGEPEGGEGEVHFRLGPGPVAGSPAALWRRARPVPGLRVGTGGVAAPIVDGVVELVVRASDGTSWFDSWDSDTDGLPHALSIAVTAVDDSGQTRASVRRVVALDRVPQPLAPAATSSDQDAPADPSAEPAGGGAR